jgi:hypothetical protein
MKLSYRMISGLAIALVLAMPAAFAEIPKDWSSKDWSVTERLDGRIFYYTHGSKVWGHELGFIKTRGACGGDILWITYSSADKSVFAYIDQPTRFAFDVDGNQFTVDMAMLSVRTVLLTQVMTFTNFLAGDRLIALMVKGHKATIKITSPKDLVGYLDTPEETFSLIGFTAARNKADAMCRAPRKAAQNTGKAAGR